MKLMRVGPPGAERPALYCSEGKLRDLSGHATEIGGTGLEPAALDRLRALDPTTLPELNGSQRIGPCVGRPGKIVCVGLNYHDHAKEIGIAAPEEPVLFSKATSSLSGPNDDIEMPRDAHALDYEVELAVVIGSRARYVSEGAALAHVAGYAAFNDLSERTHQTQRGGQWMKGKSHDGFGPLGPWLVTADEVANPQALDLLLTVNGTPRQASNTATMIFSIPMLIAYISSFMTLEPGDIIATGTPAGVAMGMSEPAWLQPGDVLELAVAGLGTQRCRILPA